MMVITLFFWTGKKNEIFVQRYVFIAREKKKKKNDLPDAPIIDSKFVRIRRCHSAIPSGFPVGKR